MNAYIPQDVWYEFSSGVQLTAVGQFVHFDTPIHKINVHLRGGYILPLKTPGDNLILTRANPFQLLVALSQSGNAHGNLYWDDGDSIGRFLFYLLSLTYSFVFYRSNWNKNIQLFQVQYYICKS